MSRKINKLNTRSIFIGIGSIIVLTIALSFIGFGELDRMLYQTVSCPLFCNIGGALSLETFVAYVISGIIVGIISKRSGVLNAIIAGIIITGLYSLLKLPNSYVLRHIESLIYFTELFIAMIAFSGIGGYIGEKIKAHKMA